MRTVKESIEVGSSIQLQFQRNQLPLENIFKEFIDNSLQSFRTPENRMQLERIGVNKCTVKITFDYDKIIINDNAYGMDHEAFRRALRLNKKADNYSKGSLGEFGMGLKYAAISLGNEYTIESTALGSSEKYKATISSDLLKLDSKFVDNIVEDDYPLEKHFTTITITKLLKNITSANLVKLDTDLSRIYHKYLENDELEIIFTPNRKVKYIQPELWINDDGSELQEDFEGELYYNDKQYSFFGWIGILKVADTSKTGNAGFSLYKQDRIIVSNYRPEKLMGGANLYPYQRIIGDISLDEWPVDFNKGSFTWNDGLEDKFIEALKKHPIISKYIKQAAELRKRSNATVPKKEDVQAITTKLEKPFSALASVKKTVIESPNTNPDERPAYLSFVEPTQPFNVEYEGIKYVLHITYSTEQDATRKWLIIDALPNTKNEYLVKINNNFDIFKKAKKADTELLQSIVTILVLAQLSSMRSGLKDSYKFINKMNEIIKLIKG